jgi:HEAT repeat protein
LDSQKGNLIVVIVKMPGEILKSFIKVCKGLLIVVFVFHICCTHECSQNQIALELINQLDSSFNVRKKENALDELHMIGTPALETLFYALKHKNWNIRKEIPRVLAWIRDPSVINPLLNALHDNDFQVALAVEGALEMLAENAVEPLIPLLETSDDSIKIRALHVLGEIALCVANDSIYRSDIRLEERNKLCRAVPPLIALLKSQNPAVKLNTLRTLRLIKDPRPVDAIIPLLEDRNYDVRIQAIRTLGVLGEYPAVEGLIETLRDKESQVRVESATALGQINNKRAALPLIECLEDRDWRVRYRAIISLGTLKDKRAIEPLVNLYKNDNNLVVKRVIIYSLGEIADDAYTIDFISKVLSDKDNYIQRNAVCALGKIGKPAVKTLIMALKRHDNKTKAIHGEIIRALTAIGDKQAFKPIIDALKDSNPDIRSEAVSALGKFKDKRAYEPLLYALQDEDNWVRKKALSILAEVNEYRAIRLIKKIAETDPVSDVRKTAQWVLRDIKKNSSKIVERFSDGNVKTEILYRRSWDQETVLKRSHYNEQEQLIKIEDLVNHTETRFAYFKKNCLRMQVEYTKGQLNGKLIEWDTKGATVKEEIWQKGKLVKKIK